MIQHCNTGLSPEMKIACIHTHTHTQQGLLHIREPITDTFLIIFLNSYVCLCMCRQTYIGMYLHIYML